MQIGPHDDSILGFQESMSAIKRDLVNGTMSIHTKLLRWKEESIDAATFNV